MGSGAGTKGLDGMTASGGVYAYGFAGFLDGENDSPVPSIIVSGFATRHLVSGGSSLACSACRVARCTSPVIGATGPCSAAALAASLAASVPSGASPIQH